MKDWLFFSRRGDHYADKFTYGDWRQYVAKRPDGSLQCCKVSAVCFVIFITGILALLFTLTGLLVSWQAPGAPLWGRIVVAGIIGAVFTTFPFVLNRMGWTIMTAVGPRQYDGRRIFPHEVEK